MAKLKFGMVVTEASGKLGGHVFARNRGGAYARTKVTPVNPQTQTQQLARAVLTNFSQEWRSLTDAQRAAWNGAVADFAKTDIFGDLRNPTGKNLYVRLNVNISIAGGTPISVPPLPSDVTTFLPQSATIAVGPSNFLVAFSGSDANMEILVEATAGLSPGVGFFKNKFRIIETYAGNTASPLGIWSDYVAKFGTPTVGTRIAVRISGIDPVTGLRSTPGVVSAIVAA